MKGKRKWSLGVLGLAAVVLLALTGHGDPAAYGALSMIVGVIGGGQAAVDWVERTRGDDGG